VELRALVLCCNVNARRLVSHIVSTLSRPCLPRLRAALECAPAPLVGGETAIHGYVEPPEIQMRPRGAIRVIRHAPSKGPYARATAPPHKRVLAYSPRHCTTSLSRTHFVRPRQLGLRLR